MTTHAGNLLVNEIMPIVAATVPRVVRTVGCEDHAELVSDVLATAAKFVDSCERRGKKLIPNSIAYYAIQQAKEGRRSYSASRMDALCPAACLDESVELESLDAPVEGVDHGDEPTLHELLATNGEDPSQVAARELDWAELLEDFNERDITLLQQTVNGGQMKALAAQFGVSGARLSQLKRELGEQVKLRWGSDALADAVRNPVWNASVTATRERHACQHERALEARSR